MLSTKVVEEMIVVTLMMVFDYLQKIRQTPARFSCFSLFFEKLSKLALSGVF